MYFRNRFRIYEEKRSEAIKTLQRAEDKVGDADNIVNLLQQRMAELEQEKAELQLYQKNLGQVNLMEAAKTGADGSHCSCICRDRAEDQSANS